jgi:serine/threonine protein kinase/Tol biopolymer transport system component
MHSSSAPEMNLERWNRIEAIYNSALEVETADRDRFVAVACADDEGLRREVLCLLSSADCLDSFMNEPELSLGLTLLGGTHQSLAGVTVGPYKLLELLGRGGMGEVYLAHDPRLNRRIALKLLPPGVDSDLERVRRFELEARAASAISHPNVAQIFEIGSVQDRCYITMEYVKGQTLRQILKQRQLGVGEVVDIAGQVASALAAAHEAGVVHRDIKPENIMLRHDGYVKVLDFGLAKLVENRSSGSDPHSSPVLSIHTEPEILMGTSDYMSPEQVRRQTVDESTDIWSLGVVLYEMLAGSRPFTGRDQSEVIVAILESEPEPVENLRPGLIPAVQEVLSRTLQKTSGAREGSALILAAELKAIGRLIGEDPQSDSAEAEFVNRSASSRERSPGLRPEADRPNAFASVDSRPYGVLARMAGFRMGALASTNVSVNARRFRPLYWLILLSVISAGIYFLLLRPGRHSLLNSSIDLKFERLNLPGNIDDLTLSPDGKYIASVVSEKGKESIHIFERATGSDLRLAPATGEGYSGLTFSPDGTYLYYLEVHGVTGTLFRVSKFGGDQRKLLSNIKTPVTFSPDGKQIAFIRNNGESGELVVAQADGSSEHVVASRSVADNNFFLSDIRQAGPAWSPDGKILACPTYTLNHGDLQQNIDVLGIESGTGHRLNATSWRSITRLGWLADGSGLIASIIETAGAPPQIRLLSYPGGEKRNVTTDPNNYYLVSGTRDSSMFLTLNVESNTSVWQVSSKESTQSATLPISHTRGISDVDWSTDGTLLYSVNDGRNINIWRQSPGETSARQLTFESLNYKPATSPDGRFIVFTSKRAGSQNIWRMNTDGSNPVRLTSGGYEDMASVTRDGKWVVYYAARSIMKVPTDGGTPIKLVEKPTYSPALSPDGRLLAFFTNDKQGGDPWHIEVYDLQTLDRIARIEPADAANPLGNLRWTPDGRELSYVSAADGESNIWQQPLGGGAPRQITHFKDAEILSFSWSADGSQVVCVRNSKAYIPLLFRLH